MFLTAWQTLWQKLSYVQSLISFYVLLKGDWAEVTSPFPSLLVGFFFFLTGQFRELQCSMQLFKNCQKRIRFYFMVAVSPQWSLCLLLSLIASLISIHIQTHISNVSVPLSVFLSQILLTTEKNKRCDKLWSFLESQAQHFPLAVFFFPVLFFLLNVFLETFLISFESPSHIISFCFPASLIVCLHSLMASLYLCLSISSLFHFLYNSILYFST